MEPTLDKDKTNTLANAIDRFAELTGKCLSWMVIAMMVVTFLVVVLRYGFNIGSIAMQESIIYLHASVFLLGAAYTFQQDSHVRVDIFYRNFSRRQQAWVNAVGGVVFLLPISVFLLAISWGFVEASWQIKETSAEAGGLPFVYLLKSLIPGMAILLILQAISSLLRSLTILMSTES